jgi:RimJ/RimL family protein N-acetyltransferase
MAEASRDPAIERYNGPAPASVADAVAVVERLATRAVKLMTGWLLELGAGRVFLTIQSENAASSAVARRAGFSFEGTLRADGVRQGQRQDVDVFAVLPGEWSLEGSA